MNINIELDDSQAQKAIARLIKAGTDMSPVMRDIGEPLLNATRERFRAQVSPDGTLWAPLSAVTLAKKRKNKDKILTEAGYLSGNLVYRVGRNYVEVASPSVYANTHQFGAKQGAFGKNKRGTPIPNTDRDAIQAIIIDYIAERWV